MCHRTERRQICEPYSAIHPLIHQRLARTAQSLLTNRRGTETQRSWAIQSFEKPYCHLGFEIQGPSFAIRFHRTSPGHPRSTQARLVFRRLRKQRAVCLVLAGAISPTHDRCRHLLRERLLWGCCAVNHGVAVTAACSQFAGLNQATC